MCSEREVLLAFSLANVLRATTAFTFSTSQLPKVVRTLCVLCILIWKCASRHNGVQLFMSHLTTWLRTRRFSEPTCVDPPDHKPLENTVFRDFPTFSRTWIFFLLRFSLALPISAFHLSILSEVWLLNFLRGYISCSSIWYLQKIACFPGHFQPFPVFFGFARSEPLEAAVTSPGISRGECFAGFETAAAWKPAKPSDPWAAGGENSVDCCNQLGALLGAREQLWDG